MFLPPRTIEDTAILLNVLAKRWFAGQKTPDYTEFLNPHSLQGARIGIARRLFQPEFVGEPDIVAVLEDVIDKMHTAGATIVDPVDTDDPFAWSEADLTVLLYEFKNDIDEYLATLSDTSMRTLGDLNQFNIEHCEQEMKYFGQELFEMAAGPAAI